MAQQPQAKSLTGVYCLLVLCVFLWSSAFVGIRFAVGANHATGYHPGSLAFVRYLVASIALIPFWFSLPNRQKIVPKDWPKLIIIAIVGISAYNVTLNYSEIHLSAAEASFVISQVPVISALLAACFLNEHLTLKPIIGIAISFIGVCIISSDNLGSFDLRFSLLFAIAAALCASLYTILQKPVLGRNNAVQCSILLMWLGTLFLGLVYWHQSWHDLTHASWIATSSVVYLGIFPAAIAYMLWSYVLSHLTATKTSTGFYLVPLFAAFLGWIVLGEAPTLLTLGGGIIALIGAYIVNKRRRYKPTQSTGTS